MMPTAAAVIIGDELLSGATEDRNSPRLIAFLRAHGVDLKRVTILGDDPEAIAQEVHRAATTFDHVFTSGGVGPTHDDRTIEGVAKAFGCKVVRSPRLEQAIRRLMGDRVTDAALKMADVPDGTQLWGEDAFPTIRFRNVFVLPGVPELFAQKLALLRHHFHGHPPLMHRIFALDHESDIASTLSTLDQSYPQVKIGSYPQRKNPDYRVMITIESNDLSVLDLALGELQSALGQKRILRVERADSAAHRTAD
jgi:molybdenum cofactor synthesis domain-containing protein